MHISSQFDSGAIEIVAAADPADIRLNIRSDSAAEFRQWFHFRVSGVAGQSLVMRLLNAGDCTYSDGWHGYQAVASYDRRHWFRVPTAYDGKVLTISHTAECDSVYYAYFEPYSWERHLDLIAQAAADMRVTRLSSSLQGRDIDKLSWGSGAQQVWIIARQHPGESMTEWLVEGLIERLLDPADPVARKLAQLAMLHIVPNMNPDGAALGNLRSNAAGANLNREWMAPSLEKSPEVLHARQAMHDSGVDLFLDIHGDETIPYVFVDGCEMIPGYAPSLVAQQEAFLARLLQISPDFQREHGYAPDRFSDEMLTLASKYVGHAFGCVSLTLEMPFKDNANLPDPEHGWSAARSKRLGAALLEAVLAHCIDSKPETI
ncbi:M14-type cytosolic carboxypeptidase [Sulfuriferula sp. GW1]|uniref:M14 family metallopeptidase n=1 Tax=Sulfuriferula sp. GW1 TaxID=3345111 RepID=UPI0039AFA156